MRNTCRAGVGQRCAGWNENIGRVRDEVDAVQDGGDRWRWVVLDAQELHKSSRTGLLQTPLFLFSYLLNFLSDGMGGKECVCACVCIFAQLYTHIKMGEGE